MLKDFRGNRVAYIHTYNSVYIEGFHIELVEEVDNDLGHRMTAYVNRNGHRNSYENGIYTEVGHSRYTKKDYIGWSMIAMAEAMYNIVNRENNLTAREADAVRLQICRMSPYCPGEESEIKERLEKEVQ